MTDTTGWAGGISLELAQANATIARLEAELEQARIATVEGVLDLLSDASLPLGDQRKGTITTESNGYSVWLVPVEQEPWTTAPLSNEQILERIDERGRQRRQQLDR